MITRTGAALDISDSVRRAQEHLISRQDPAGWWKGELATNVTMDAEDLLLRQFLGILDPVDLDQAARWIRSQQRDDGTWANFFGGPADLSTTIEAYAALRLAGDDTRQLAAQAGPRVHPDQRRDRGQPGIHPPVAGAVRRMVVGRPARDAARDHPAAQMGPAERLRLGLLGPADRRPDHDRRDLAPGPSAAVLAGRAAHAPDAGAPIDRPGRPRVQRPRPGAEGVPPGWLHAGAARGHAPGRRVDHRPAGGRRRLGRHPAALGVLDPGPAPARLFARFPGGGGRDQGPGRVSGPRADAGRAGAPPRGLPVARVGRVPGRNRIAGFRNPGGPSRGCTRSAMAARRGDPGDR